MAERKGTLGSTPSRPITKRVRGTPTGNTPQQPKKRSSVRGPHAAASRAPVPRRQLSFSGGESTTARQSKLTGKVKVQEWTVEEEMALVDFVHWRRPATTFAVGTTRNFTHSAKSTTHARFAITFNNRPLIT